MLFNWVEGVCSFLSLRYYSLLTLSFGESTLSLIADGILYICAQRFETIIRWFLAAISKIIIFTILIKFAFLLFLMNLNLIPLTRTIRMLCEWTGLRCRLSFVDINRRVSTVISRCKWVIDRRCLIDLGEPSAPGALWMHVAAKYLCQVRLILYLFSKIRFFNILQRKQTSCFCLN